MLSLNNIFDTIDMIDKQHLDIRTITMGISLLDCVSEEIHTVFLCFPNFLSNQNLSPSALADLFGASLIL